MMEKGKEIWSKLAPGDALQKSGDYGGQNDKLPKKEAYSKFDNFFVTIVEEIADINCKILLHVTSLVSNSRIIQNTSFSDSLFASEFLEIKENVCASINLFEDYFVRMSKSSKHWSSNNETESEYGENTCTKEEDLAWGNVEEGREEKLLSFRRFDRASLRFHLFVEICKLKSYYFVLCNRLIPRSVNIPRSPWEPFVSPASPASTRGGDDASSYAISDFPVIKTWKLALDRKCVSKEKAEYYCNDSCSLWSKKSPNDPASSSSSSSSRNDKKKDEEKKISLFSQSDLEECFRIVMCRWKMVDYHEELERYISLLVYRMCCIISFNGTAERCFSSEDKDETKSQKYITSESYYLDVPEFTCWMPFSSGRGDKKLLRKICNFDYIHRQESRFFDIMEKFHRMNFRRIMIEIKELPPKMPSVESDRYVLSIDDVASFFKEWIERWCKNDEFASFSSSDLRNRYLKLLLPSCDVQWLKYAYPTEPPTVTNTFRNMHETTYEMMVLEAGRSAASIIGENSVSTRKLYDEVVFQTLETLFLDCDEGNGIAPPGDVRLSHLRELLFKEEIEDMCIKHSHIVRKPFLAYVFSRLYVHIYRYADVVSDKYVSHSEKTNAEEEGKYDDKKKINFVVRRVLPPDVNPNEIVNPLVRKNMVLYACVQDENIYKVLGRLFIMLRDYFPNSKKTKALWNRLNREMFLFKSSAPNPKDDKKTN